MTGLLDYYLGPTGAPDKIRALGKMLDYLNPVTAMGESMQASQRLFAPDTDGWGRVQATGDMLSGMAGVVAPAAVASRAGMPAANALQEGLMGFAPATRAAGQFVASEAGSVGRLSPAEAQAQNVLDYLTSGRASEVTDEMLEGADPQYLYRNYDLPMDYDSRMGRADAGWPSEGFHGTGADIREFRLNPDAPDRGVWFGSEDVASRFAGHRGEGSNVIAARTNSANPYIYDANDPGRPAKLADIFADMEDGQTGVNFVGGNSRAQTISDPRNIRSRFARFDPRLAHLRNLSAGIGTLGIMGTYGNQQDQREALRAYLDGI